MLIPEPLVGDAYTSTVVWDTMVEIAQIDDREPGHDGEKTAARVFRRRLARHVDTVTETTFEMPGWWAEAASLSVSPDYSDSEEVPTFNLPSEVVALSGSPTREVTGEIVNVETTPPAQYDQLGIDDKVVMASTEQPNSKPWVHRMKKYVAASRAGASAFILRNHVKGGLPPAGEIGYGYRPAPIPAVGVSAELGLRLIRYYGSSTAVTVRTDCRTEPAVSRTIEGILGPDTGKRIVVTAHLDSHRVGEGAADNAVGCALLVELARVLSRFTGELQTGITFVGFGAEEAGMYGSANWVSDADLSSIRCVLNLDGIAGSETLHLGLNSFSSLRAPFRQTTRELLSPLSTNETITPHGDQWSFVKEGVPAIMVSSFTEGSDRGWEHTAADTTDKVDVRNVRSIAIQLTDVLLRLANEGWEFEHRSREAIRNRLSDREREELKGRGQWPYRS